MLLPAALFLAALSHPAAIDLHVHILMDAALPVFSGHPTDAPAPVKDRKARLANQVSLKDLESADVRLVVAALYPPVVLSHARGGYHKALLKQIDALKAWASRHPQVELITTPDEAQAILDSKPYKLGVIIAAEGSHAVDTAQRLDALYDRGLRLLTIAHFTNSPWAGSAAVRYWPNPSCTPGGKDSGKRNPLGLSPLGQSLVDHAVKKGLILDLTHSSDATVMEVASRHPKLPLMFTHEAARELTPCERTISKEELQEVRRSRGLVGVTFAAEYVGEDIPALVAHAKALAKDAGPQSIALGSDYNGMIRRVEGASDSRGYVPVLEALAREGIPAHKSAEAFVDFWRRTIAAGVK